MRRLAGWLPCIESQTRSGKMAVNGHRCSVVRFEVGLNVAPEALLAERPDEMPRRAVVPPRPIDDCVVTRLTDLWHHADGVLQPRLFDVPVRKVIPELHHELVVLSGEVVEQK